MKKNQKITSIIVLFFVVVVICLSVFAHSRKVSVSITPGSTLSPYLNSNITIKTFQSADSTYGYDIFINGTQYIHQPTIPAFSGDKGFATEIDADKVAQLVVTKIRNNILPPSVTPTELQTLGIQ